LKNVHGKALSKAPVLLWRYIYNFQYVTYYCLIIQGGGKLFDNAQVSKLYISLLLSLGGKIINLKVEKRVDRLRQFNKHRSSQNRIIGVTNPRTGQIGCEKDKKTDNRWGWPLASTDG